MKSAKRPQHRRILIIDRELRTDSFPTAEQLAEAADVNVRTIRRDLEFMQLSLGAPVAFSIKQGGWHYTESTFHLPTMPISNSQVSSLALGQLALAASQAEPFAESLSSLIERLTESVPTDRRAEYQPNALAKVRDQYPPDSQARDRSMRSTCQRVADSHTILQGFPLFGSLELLNQLSRAVQQKQRLQIDYWAASRDAQTTREIDPWKLICWNGQWYVIAHCHLRQDVRMFAAWRIDAAREIPGDYHIPADFSVEQWLSGAFQLIGCGEAARHTVRLQFSPPAARYICERQWHISQTLDELPDGQVILTLQLASFVELERWILTWGEHVEVLEPASLRTRVARTSRMIAAKYRVSRATPQPRCLHNEPTTERVG